MSNEIIVVKQLPVIIERLEQVKAEVMEKVQAATSLVCTDETVKAVKKARAELNSEFKAWEEKRKEVKAAVMSPYEQFEAVYKNCITDTYKLADEDLKIKINSVEKDLKTAKEQEIREYFAEYLMSKNIDFVSFEDARINVTLTASMKSLKEQVKGFIDRIAADLVLIDTQEHKAEILVEYKKSLSVSEAITCVKARKKAIEEEKARQEAAAARKAEIEQQKMQSVKLTPPTVEPITAPKVEEEQEFTLSFKVTATKAKLRQLKAFLDKEGIKYV